MTVLDSKHWPGHNSRRSTRWCSARKPVRPGYSTSPPGHRHWPEARQSPWPRPTSSEFPPPHASMRSASHGETAGAVVPARRHYLNPVLHRKPNGRRGATQTDWPERQPRRQRSPIRQWLIPMWSECQASSSSNQFIFKIVLVRGLPCLRVATISRFKGQPKCVNDFQYTTFGEPDCMS